MATRNIAVSLNTGENVSPNVMLDNRNKSASSGDTIKWQSSGSSFTITGLAGVAADSAVFTNITTGTNKLEATFTATKPSPHDYHYTLTVTQTVDGVTKPYTTDKATDDPEVNKPVIRN